MLIVTRPASYLLVLLVPSPRGTLKSEGQRNHERDDDGGQKSRAVYKFIRGDDPVHSILVVSNHFWNDSAHVIDFSSSLQL